MIRTLFIFVATFWTMGVQAQTLLELLDEGVEAHRRYDLVKSEAILSKVLDRKDELTQSKYGQALYFFCRNQGQIVKKEGELDGFTNHIIQGKLYDVYNKYLQLERMKIPRWSEKARPDIENLAPLASAGAVACLRAMYDEPANKELFANIGEGYISFIKIIAPNHYVVPELLGQIRLLLGERERAMEQFELALKAYRNRRTLVVDNIRMADVYYQVAVYSLEKGNLSRAYSLTKTGITRNEFEWKTLNELKNKFPPGSVEQNKDLFSANQYNLGRLELELIVQFENKKDSALLLYAERAPYFDKTFSYHYNYAGLLSSTYPRKAAMHYQKAIDLEPTSYLAHFQMGALYFSTGSHYLNLKDKDRSVTAKNRETGKELVLIGMDYMEKAHTLEPQNPTPLIKLIEAAKWLELDDRRKIYKADLERL